MIKKLRIKFIAAAALSVARAIAGLHKGKISASFEGKNRITFTVTL